MSMIANSARPASSSFGASVEADGSRTSRSTPRRRSALLERRVDPGVDRVRLEVEHQGRLSRGARFSTVVPAARRGGARGRRPPAALRPIASQRVRQDSLAPRGRPRAWTTSCSRWSRSRRGAATSTSTTRASASVILDRFLSSSTVYPTDYGYLIGHRGRDGDPLDAMVCVSEPTFPGCVIPVKPIALFKMRDEKGEDDKIVCVPTHDPGWNHAETSTTSRAAPARDHPLLLRLQAARGQGRSRSTAGARARRRSR